MNNKDRRKENVQKLLLRLELWFAPWLIIFPLVISFIFIWDWYVRGFSAGNQLYDGELFIALIILFGNIVFDIFFLKSLIPFKKI